MHYPFTKCGYSAAGIYNGNGFVNRKKITIETNSTAKSIGM